MKLLLTSAGWEHDNTIGKEFLKLVGKKPDQIKIFFVITPLKYPKKNKYVKRLFKKLKAVNIPEKNITFFKLDRKAEQDDLKNIDVVFVFGGNTFDYLDRIRKTGLDKLIDAFVKKGGVYLGLSAGSYVACPSIEHASWKHADNNTIGLKNLKGLNLVPFLVTAHFEEELRPIIEQSARNTKRQVIALTDEQAVLINGMSMKIIGKGKKNIFENNKSTKQGLIKPAKPILNGNFFCYIRLRKDQFHIEGIKQEAKKKGFRKQTFRHITILSSRNLETIQTALGKGERQKITNQMKKKIKELDWSYEQKDTYLISKKVNKTENRQSYIRTIKMPAIGEFFKYVNKLLHTNIPAQYPHITLFTKGEGKNPSYYGISIPSTKEFKTLKPKKIIPHY